jgi:hypothetical protein
MVIFHFVIVNLLFLSLGLAGCGENKAKEEPQKEETQQY